MKKITTIAIIVLVTLILSFTASVSTSKPPSLVAPSNSSIKITPPTPHIVMRNKKLTIAPPAPPMPLVVASLAGFIPAASEPPLEPIIYIFDFDATHYAIVALQYKTNNLEIQYSDTLPTLVWTFLAGYGPTTEDSWDVAYIPKNWMPFGRLFVRAVNTPSTPSALVARQALVTTEVKTNKRRLIQGKIYELMIENAPNINTAGIVKGHAVRVKN